MSKVLAILEVSQKQAYIFGSNKLKDNIIHSAVIAWVTSSEFFGQIAKDQYADADNMVYSGGGHTILQFESHKEASDFVGTVTRYVLENYPGLELFARLYETSGEPKADDMKTLVDLLEVKKSRREASFRQGSFGVEEIDSNGEPVRADNYRTKMPAAERQRDIRLFLPVMDPESPDYQVSIKAREEFERAYRFEDLADMDTRKSFLAVVHIDGNAMGKRVEDFRSERLKDRGWEEVRRLQREFSENIAADFSDAYSEMCLAVAAWQLSEEQKERDGLSSAALHLRSVEAAEEDEDLGMPAEGKRYFPIRRIISAGDDMCFVTEGSIGLECARIFMEKLAAKQNKTDRKGYASCAGVAIVHQKFPFYRAYELAEKLCSSAKRYIVTQMGEDASAEVSAIDWHIEFGEPGDTVKDIRSGYVAEDGTHMELRPYIVSPGKYTFFEDFSEEKKYTSFRSREIGLQGSGAYARGKYKELRDEIRLGRTAAENYTVLNLMSSPAFGGGDTSDGNTQEQQPKDRKQKTQPELYMKLTEKVGEKKAEVERSLLFDSIEMMDVYRPIDG